MIFHVSTCSWDRILIKCMKKEEILVLFQEYEQAACEVNQVECWSARDLQKLLGYSLWQNFTKVIAKAKEACENVGQPIEDHFIDVNKMIITGKGAQREVERVKARVKLHEIETLCKSEYTNR